MMSRQVAFKNTIARWELATRALFRKDQKYGKALVAVLKSRTEREIAIFEDPVEAAVFYLMIEMMKAANPEYPASPLRIVPEIGAAP